MIAGDLPFFSFVLANKANERAPWQPITPTEAPAPTQDNQAQSSRFELIQQGFKRVFDERAVDMREGWILVD